jgi:hypothetical protein
MAETEPLPVLGHFQRLQEDIAINANNGPCGALRGVSAQESLVGTEIPTNFFNISSQDDVNTVVVVGRLADVPRILPNAHFESSSLHKNYDSARFKTRANVLCCHSDGSHAASCKEASG